MPSVSSPRRLFAAALVAAGCGTAIAQSAWPARTVRILVPAAPGSPSDVLARLLAERLGARFGQPVVVENKPGAGGNLAAREAARADPDGHTLIIIPDTVVTVNPIVYRDTGFDPRVELVAISVLASTSQMLVCNTQAGMNDVNQLVARGKQVPLTFASGGAGSPGHLTQALLAEATGIQVTHVPYKGPAPAVAALLGGEVQCGFLTTPTVLPHVKTGTLRALAISSSTRSPLAPEVAPLGDQLGRHDADATFSLVLMAATGTPAPILGAIEAAARDALAPASTRTRLAALDLVAVGSTGAAAARTLREAVDRWAPVVKRLDLKSN